ncbi:Mitochondrial distribution and morphology protein 31, mitochondrial precursor [Elasticomyces elasticus]|nr:Mitochondrial distribution and morphology protein 31, mitochondrial precursor [Elasticomyces elasticus]
MSHNAVERAHAGFRSLPTLVRRTPAPSFASGVWKPQYSRSSITHVRHAYTVALLSNGTAPRSRQLSRRLPFGATLSDSRVPASTVTLAGAAWQKQRKLLCTPLQQLLNRRIHSSQRSLADAPKDADTKRGQEPAQQQLRDDAPTPDTHEHGATGGAGKHLLDRLPHMPHLPHLPHLHRPTKEELLAAATGFWSRLAVRFKWSTIRSARPFNADEISAFVSWIFLGHIVWIIVGTTTFFSLAIFAVNTVFAQETLAGWVGNYLTKSSGLKVVFESAIVPEWRGGVIQFKNVFVSRRPGQGKAKVTKGSSTSAAATAAAAAHAEKTQGLDRTEEEEDTNYTQFDVSIDTVNVTLSFTKWFNGKGPLADVEVKGIRGEIDRTSVQWNHNDPVDPRSYLHEHHTGDFEIDSFKMEDVLVTVYQPNSFRPFSVSIFNCDLPRLRKQWLFYDFLSANNMSGSFDDSLFTIHPRQTHNYTGAHLDAGQDVNGDPSQWKKHSRLRVDGLKIDHLNRGIEGPFSWIYEGNVDIVADVMFPVDADGSIAKVMSDFYDRVEATVTSHSYLHTTHQHDTSDQHDPLAPPPPSPNEKKPPADDNDTRFLVMDLRVHLNDVRAAVPLFTKDLSYVNNALVRPIVAYINSKRAFIPVNCRVVKRASEFDGSWTVFDSGLMGDLSREMYEAFARDIVDDQARVRRLKKVGLWTIQLAAQALFIGLAGQLA